MQITKAFLKRSKPVLLVSTRGRDQCSTPFVSSKVFRSNKVSDLEACVFTSRHYSTECYINFSTLNSQKALYNSFMFFNHIIDLRLYDPQVDCTTCYKKTQKCICISIHFEQVHYSLQGPWGPMSQIGLLFLKMEL